MKTRNILYKRSIPANKRINIVIPTVGEIIDNEDAYYDLVYKLTAMPVDMMVALDDAKIDFTTIDEFTLFLLLFNGIREADTSLVFGDLDLGKFELSFSEETGEPSLVDTENDIVIDKYVHSQIASTLRFIHKLEKNTKKPGNEAAKKFMIDIARKKQNRNKNRQEDSQLESLIIAMVNTEQFKYDFEGTRELSIYQFNESVRQVIKKIEFDNRMHGIYAGTVNAKDLSPDDLNWLTHK